MARLADITYVTQDEQSLPAERVAQRIEEVLQDLKLDTYNNQYVIRITVDTVGSLESSNDDEEDD